MRVQSRWERRRPYCVLHVSTNVIWGPGLDAWLVASTDGMPVGTEGQLYYLFESQPSCWMAP